MTIGLWLLQRLDAETAHNLTFKVLLPRPWLFRTMLVLDCAATNVVYYSAVAFARCLGSGVSTKCLKQ